MSFEFGRQSALVDLYALRRAALDGWAWADAPLVREVPGSRLFYHRDDESGDLRLVAVMAAERDMEAAREIIGKNRKIIPCDPRPVRRGDVVGAEQIARRLGVKLNTVTKWAERYEDFPESITKIGGAHAYDWREVERWARRRTAKKAKQSA